MNIEKNAGEKVIYDLPSTLFKMSPYFPNGMFVVYVLKGRIPRRRSTSVSVWATSRLGPPPRAIQTPTKNAVQKEVGRRRRAGRGRRGRGRAGSL